jgi:signal transduction histidine kinase
VHDNIEAFLCLLKKVKNQSIFRLVHRWTSVNRSLHTIRASVEKSSNFLFSLRNFSHFEHTSEKVPADLIEGIETVLVLYHSQIRHHIEVIRKYQVLPLILCYPNELNQIWMNLIHNAIQAMAGKGTLTIETTLQDEQIFVSITDTGKGISNTIRPHIFEPFFTTGAGNGLGLGIAKNIIEKHQGKIEITSQPGKTTFQVSMPLNPESQTIPP